MANARFPSPILHAQTKRYMSMTVVTPQGRASDDHRTSQWLGRASRSPPPGKSGMDAVRVRARIPVNFRRAGHNAAELVTFYGLNDGKEHLACIVASQGSSAPLVRIHSECLTGDVFGSTRCDCGPQLSEILGYLAQEGGVLLYLRQEGRGIGLYNKLDAYLLQDRGIDTFEANRLLGRRDDERDYGVAASMLKALGYRRIRLLTNNPDKVEQLKKNGIEIADVVATGIHMTPDNTDYLKAKAEHAGHTTTAP
jgi:GTP cyclohydrolase II